MLNRKRKARWVAGAIACLLAAGPMVSQAAAERGGRREGSVNENHRVEKPVVHRPKQLGLQRPPSVQNGHTAYQAAKSNYHRDRTRGAWHGPNPRRDHARHNAHPKPTHRVHRDHRDHDRHARRNRSTGFSFSFGHHDGGSGVHVGVHCNTRPRYEVRKRWVAGHHEWRKTRVHTQYGYTTRRKVSVWVPGYWETHKVIRPHNHGPSCSVRTGVHY